MSKENYEKLMTLAKQEYIQRTKALDITEIDEILYSSREYSLDGIEGKQRYIAKKIFKPLMADYTENAKQCRDTITELCELSKTIEIEVNTEEKEWTDKIIGSKNAIGDLWKVTAFPTETEEVVVYGYTQNKKAGLDMIGKQHPGINVVDIPYFFAGIFLYKKLIKELQRLQNLTKEEREQDYHYKALLEEFWESMLQYPKEFQKTSDEARAYCENYMEEAREYKESHPRGKNTFYNIYITANNVCRSHYGRHMFQYYMLEGMLSGEIPFHGYYDFVNYSAEEGKGWKTLSGTFSPFRCYNELLFAAEASRGSVVSNYRNSKVLESEYAKSYMTKKNKSEKLKKKTEQSLFYKYFGYVEYDEDIDYQAIAQYEKEFETFYHKFLQRLDLSKNVIRFRRLGQHHAAGLYYPAVRCLCVDIENPSSFLHELGHLIDYEYGNLSTQQSFAQIREDTQAYLQELLEEGDELAKKLKGKTKYNMDYYLIPTEIFARSFELYVFYVLQQKNSLLPEKYERVYDCTEKNLQHIKKYFDNLFQNL